MRRLGSRDYCAGSADKNARLHMAVSDTNFPVLVPGYLLFDVGAGFPQILQCLRRQIAPRSDRFRRSLCRTPRHPGGLEALGATIEIKGDLAVLWLTGNNDCPCMEVRVDKDLAGTLSDSSPMAGEE